MSISENLFLHGDASASDTISLMAAPFCNNVTLFQGIGNFGTRVDPTGIGAPRYTYVKPYSATKELIYPDLDIVPLKENYDGSAMEPINFLPLVPMVLVNGISGIAVGWSTCILPRSLSDVIDATIKVIDGKSIKPLTPSYDYLDCEIIPNEGNSWIFNGKLEKVNSNTIRVLELPPELSLESYKEKLNKMIDDGVIVDYDDNSAEGINIEIKFQRKVLDGKTIPSLISMLKLSTKKTERIVVLDFNNTSIKQYDNDVNLIKDFVKWRFGWYKVRYTKKKDDDSYELNYWRALKECFDKKLPTKMPKFKNKSDLESEIKNITKSIVLDQKQIDKITSLPTFRWVSEYYSIVEDSIKSLEDNITYYDSLLQDDSKMKEIYKKELSNLKACKF